MIFLQTGSIIGGDHNPILSQLSIQGATGDSQLFCGLVFISPGLLQDLQDKVFPGYLLPLSSQIVSPTVP